MRTQPGHDGEATSLVACSGARSARLRLSVVDVLFAVLRWTGIVGGALAVLWIGALLSAAPASAAVAPVVMVTAGAPKGGKDKPSGGKGANTASSTKASSGKPARQAASKGTQKSAPPSSARSASANSGHLQQATPPSTKAPKPAPKTTSAAIFPEAKKAKDKSGDNSAATAAS